MRLLQMCIRDRDIIQCLGTTPAEFFTDEEPEQIVFKQEDYFEKTDEEKHCCIAVSYTHLDVYKRQPFIQILRHL